MFLRISSVFLLGAEGDLAAIAPYSFQNGGRERGCAFPGQGMARRSARPGVGGTACRETAMITLALARRNTHSDLGKCLSQGETRRPLIHPSSSSTEARSRAVVAVSKVLIDG